MSEQTQNPDRRDDDFESHEAALRRSQAWDALAKLYERQLALPTLAEEPETRAQLLEKRGLLLERHLDDPGAAVQAYQLAAQLAPEDPSPLRRLRELYTAREQHAMTLQIAEAELARTSEPGPRARLLDHTAEIWETALGESEQAEALRTRAAEERARIPMPPPEREPEPEVEVESDAATQQAWLAAARGKSTEAIEGLLEALSREPEDVEAIDMLVMLLEDSGRQVETAEWLERRAQLAEAEIRAAVLLRLGRVRVELGDLGTARDAYEEALALEPRIPGGREALIGLYQTMEAWTHLRGLLETGCEQGSDRERIDALLMLGELLETRLDNPDAAQARFAQVLELEPDHHNAAQAVGRIEAKLANRPRDPDDEEVAAERALRILGVLQRKLEALASEQRQRSPEAVQLRQRIAELQSESLGDLFGAIGTLEPLLDSESALDAVANDLAKLYELAGHFESLSALADRMAGREQGPERTRWLHRAASIAQEAGQTDLAIAAFERILAETPNDSEAEQALQDLYRARGSTGPLVASLRRSLARSERKRERSIHLELATHLEGPLDDAPGALIHLTRAVELDPSDLDVLERALAVAGLVGGQLAQLDLLDQASFAATDPGLRAVLFARRASHLADQLGWQDEATAGWQLALELDPSCAEACDRLGERART